LEDLAVSDSVRAVAEALYSSGCLKFGRFKIKSGATSPYYVDLAMLLSEPKNLCDIADLAANEIQRIRSGEHVDKLATVELKGAFVLPSIGCRVNLPCVVVRKEDKAYGVTGRTAGAEVISGENILFFDDVISEGLSKLEAIKPLEELGAKVAHVLVVVDREQGGAENLEKLGYRVHALARISKMVESLSATGCVPREQMESVLNYIDKKP